jgi:predicted dehydrogenase
MKTVAVVGYGYWGPNILRVLIQNNIANVKYLCDLNKSRLEAVSQKFPDLKTTREYDDVLKDPSVDAVFIITPINTHYELAEKALLHNKDVFVEKPITNSVETTEKLILLAKEKGKILMVGHTFEFSPPVMETDRIIKSGELGLNSALL